MPIYLAERAVTESVPELFAVWTQADETARTKAAQRPAPISLRQEPAVEARSLVYRCLEIKPDLTRAELAIYSGLSLDTVYAAIRWLADRGQIVRRGTRSSTADPVRWSVAR